MAARSSDVDVKRRRELAAATDHRVEGLVQLRCAVTKPGNDSRPSIGNGPLRVSRRRSASETTSQACSRVGCVVEQKRSAPEHRLAAPGVRFRLSTTYPKASPPGP